MLPDNYSGSKFDNRKPSVKRSARHHHQQQRQRQQRDRFLLCTAVHSLRSRGEREREREHKATTTEKEEEENKRFDSSKRMEPKRNLSFSYANDTNARTGRRRRKKTKEVNDDDACSLFLFLPLFRTAFLVLRVIECVNASEVRRFFFQVTPRGKKMLRGLKILVTLNMKLALVNPKTWWRSWQKKETHTHTDSTMGVSTSYLSLSLFSLARWVQMISQKMNFDAFMRLYLRAMSVCARVCTAKFSAPPGRFYF